MTIFAMLVAGWLMPMFDDRGRTGLSQGLVVAVAVACCVAGLYFMRGAADPGPLARGEAQWRYRSRPLRERIARTRMRLSRTPGWWATRLEFAIAIGAALLPPLLVPAAMAPTFGDVSPRMGLAWLVIGEAASLVGLAWMIRIYRAPLRMDSKAYWRYRDGA